LEAIEKYTEKEFVFQSEIWGWLRTWREYVERNLQFEPIFMGSPPYEQTPPSTDEGDIVEYLKNLILCAVFYGQKEILQAVVETAMLTKPPEPYINTVRAVIIAFSNLFTGAENGYPTKKEVRAAATDILNKARLSAPLDREWPKIFKKAGLSKLPQARKSKRA
jgi:hypothetical protein